MSKRCSWFNYAIITLNINSTGYYSKKGKCILKGSNKNGKKLFFYI